MVYSQDSDKAFCFCCKLFGTSASPFSCGTNEWEGFSKKIKKQENGVSRKKCFRQWLLLKEDISSRATINRQAMYIFFAERTFWRNILERLIDMVMFLAERNLAFRGSNETLVLQHNGNFLGLFEVLAKRGPVLNELENRTIQDKSKQHSVGKHID